VPTQIQVTFAGVVDHDPAQCDEVACPDFFNDSFILSQVECSLSGQGDCCQWQYAFGSETCHLDGIVAFVTPGPLNIQFQVKLYDGTPDSVPWMVKFVKTYGESVPDCDAWNNTDIPLSVNQGECQWASATCKVTAL
jgi:hypothetical protein